MSRAERFELRIELQAFGIQLSEQGGAALGFYPDFPCNGSGPPNGFKVALRGSKWGKLCFLFDPKTLSVKASAVPFHIFSC